MINNDYQEAMVEVIYVLQHSEDEIIRKIPMNIITFLKENASATYSYSPSMTENEININNIKLKSKTRAILASLYRDYLCNEEEKIEYNKKLLQNEIEFQETLKKQYSNKEIFKQNNRNTITEDNLPQVIKPKSLLKKILEKIINIFKIFA